IFFGPRGVSNKPAATLYNLDLISIGVGREKEAREGLALIGKIFEIANLQTLGLEAGMLRLEIFDGHCQMAITIAQFVGLRPVEVDGELDLEIGLLGVAQINERESFELQPVTNFQPECAAIEIDRSVLVENADHRMDGLGHENSEGSGRSPHLGISSPDCNGPCPYRGGIDFAAWRL